MSHLLERDAEVAALRTLLAGICDGGREAAVLLEGQPGIGKTALLDAALAHELPDGTTVLRARGSELESGLAFGGVRQLFADAVVRLDDEERGALLQGPAAMAAPVLGLAGGRDGDTAHVDPLFGLYWMAVGLAERGPLVLAIDDLHWLDEESARFVGYLLPRLEGLALVVIATARAPEPGVDDVVSAVQASFETVVRPRALSSAAISRMVDGPPPAETYRVTGGNPLLAVELARSLASAPHGTPLEELGSPTVARLVLDRVAKVSPAAVALARALALFAGGAELEDAAAVAGLAAREAEEAADGLVAAQVLADEEPLVFLHPMMRAAVYEQLGVFARRRGHTRAAERLKERGAGIEAIAAHLLAGPPQGDPENLRILRAAADEAVRHVAPRAAARYLQRAVAEDAAAGEELRALLLQLGRLQRQTSDPAAQATLERALAESGPAPQRIEAAIDLAAAALAGGDHAAVGRVVLATRDVEARPDDRLTLDMLHAEALWSCSDYRGCIQLIERVPPTLPGHTPAQRFALVQSASVRLLRGAPIADTLELLLRSIGDRGADALVGGVDVGDPVGWLIACEAFDEARALAEERMEYARETGNEALFAISQGHIGWIHSDLGDLLGGEAAYRLGLANLGLASLWRTQLTINLLLVLIYRGRLDEASAELDALGDDETVVVQSRRAEVAHWSGDAERAVALWEARIQAETESGIIHPVALLWRCDLVDSLAAVGRRDEAIAMARDLAERSELTGGVAARGAHRLALGRVTGDLHELQRAHEILEPSPLRWHAARARLDLGAGLRRAGERVAAREHLRAALDYASRHGAEPLAERAREELRLAGARPRRAALSGADALTPAEQRIARLAAEGRSNKAIAQHLFLTVKTVEMTLVRAYRKLDINSRQELPSALEQAA